MFQDVDKSVNLKSPDKKIRLIFSIILDNYSEQDLLSNSRFIILAPFSASKRLNKKKCNTLCHEWAKKIR